MSDLPIRDATPADLDALAAPIAGLPLLRRYRTEPAALRRAWAAAVERGDTLLVAGEPAVGLAWLQPTAAFGVCAYLRLLAVMPERQSGGAGAVLLAAAETRLKATCNHLYLFTTSDNAGAHRFYERHGYRHVGLVPGLVHPDLDEVLYHKALRDYGERLPG